MKIVVLDGYTANPGDLSWDGLKRLGDVTVYDRSEPEEVVGRIRDAECVLTNKVVLGKTEIDQLPKLRYIGVLATGYNVVDITYCHEKGIVVSNIPAYSTMSVAQMVFAHILNITNHVARHAADVAKGDWEKSKDFCFFSSPQQELWHKTLSIVGLGNTGSAVARIGLAFGMRVLVMSSKSREKLAELGFEKAQNYEQLFREADVLSLNCPLTADTHNLVNAGRLSWMKPSAILINTGRGPLVDEQALADALNAGKIAAAGIDVMETEPPRNGSPLIGAKNCFITPHIAWATKSARTRLLDIAVDNVKAFICGKPQNIV